jgi:transposase-like protein
VLPRLIVERSAGGMSQRDSEGAVEKARGQCVVSKRAVSDITDRLSHAYAAFRTRELSGFDIAYVCIDPVYEPLRRWGRKTGGFWGWGIGGDGRKVLLTLSTVHSES